MIENLSKKLPNGKPLLKDVSFSIAPGEFVAILGTSGVGKTILLRFINRLTTPDGGRIVLNGHGSPIDITANNAHELRAIRRRIGMIFQNFSLVKRLSVMDNVLAGRLGYADTIRNLIFGFSDVEISTALMALRSVGIIDLADRKAGTLSGGEMQRVAIARALVQEPYLLLADEPIANLDPNTSERIMELLREVTISKGIGTLAVLHQPDIARKYATRIIGIRDGLVCYDGSPNLSREDWAVIYGTRSVPLEGSRIDEKRNPDNIAGACG
jgi:phosphonate transport system ATP-binding protein